MKAITWCPTGEHPISTGVPRMPAGHVQNEMHHFISRDSHSLAFPNLGKRKSSDPIAQGGGPGVIPDASLAHIPSILLERVTALLTSIFLFHSCSHYLHATSFPLVWASRGFL